MIRPPAFACALLALLAGCAKPPPPRPVPTPPVLLISPPEKEAPAPAEPELVVTTERCPSAADIRRLRAARPKPLRTQPMPASPAERVARTTAQLGLYEARGAWADQVDDLLARCINP